MNKLTLLSLLFAIIAILEIVFCILLLLQDTSGNIIGRIGICCGLVSQLLLAVVIFFEIRKNKKAKH